MGSNMATELASGMLNVSMRDGIVMHLRSNHYPPIPSVMADPCMEAIDAYFEDDVNRLIKLPIDGVDRNGEPFQIRWRDGSDSAPAWALIEHAHLQAWLAEDEYYEDED